jgi:hypothetical protein
MGLKFLIGLVGEEGRNLEEGNFDSPDATSYLP